MDFNEFWKKFYSSEVVIYFRIIFEEVAVTGGSDYPSAKIQSIHNNAFLRFYKEGFFHYGIKDSDTVVIGNKVDITWYGGEVCEQIPNSYPYTHSYNKFSYLQTLAIGDTVWNTDYWSSNSTGYMICPEYSYLEKSEYHNTPDTTYYNHVTTDKSCYSVPFDQDFYMRTKVNEKRRSKLGWIKLNVNAERIIIKEVAMQE